MLLLRSTIWRTYEYFVWSNSSPKSILSLIVLSSIIGRRPMVLKLLPSLCKFYSKFFIYWSQLGDASIFPTTIIIYPWWLSTIRDDFKFKLMMGLTFDPLCIDSKQLGLGYTRGYYLYSIPSSMFSQNLKI